MSDRMTEIHRSDAELALMSSRIACCRPAASATSPRDIVIREGARRPGLGRSGNEYVDYLLGSGPMFIGHAHPEVTAAVQGQIPLGTTFFANNGTASDSPRRSSPRCPAPSRCASSASGTEADLYAMRAARAFRGRDKILKFEGGYHGMSDYGLMSLAPKRLEQFPAAGARLGRHPAKRARRRAGRALQRRRAVVRADRGASRRDRRRHRRALPAAHPAGARLPPGAARGDARASASR